LVWAVTLVNIQHPAVLKNLLRAAAPLAMRKAVINGITSALLIWRNMVPEDREFAPAYTRRLPLGARDADQWNDLVVLPAARALAATDHRIAALFQYRDLTEFRL